MIAGYFFGEVFIAYHVILNALCSLYDIEEPSQTMAFASLQSANAGLAGGSSR
jgi:hypothetical protein